MRPRLFITGGSGLLGVNWALEARKQFDVTIGIHTRRVSISDVSCVAVSLDSPEALYDALVADPPFAVVHTAGMTSVEACEADPARAHHVNVEIARNVAATVARLPSRMVHISTDHLFGHATSPVGEDTPVSPTNVYGRTKAAAEEAVLEACPSALVVRTNFFGWGPPYRPSFSDTIIGSLRAGHRVILFSDVCYTPILIKPLVWAVHNLMEANASGVFHVTGDEQLTKHEFGLRLADVFGLDRTLIREGSLKERGTLAPRPNVMSLSNLKARSVIGRPLGGIGEHLELLLREERSGRAAEVRAL